MINDNLVARPTPADSPSPSSFSVQNRDEELDAKAARVGLRMDEKVWRAKGLGNNREMIISMSLTFAPW